jgi:hypothetical protein
VALNHTSFRQPISSSPTTPNGPRTGSISVTVPTR